MSDQAVEGPLDPTKLLAGYAKVLIAVDALPRVLWVSRRRGRV